MSVIRIKKVSCCHNEFTSTQHNHYRFSNCSGNKNFNYGVLFYHPYKTAGIWSLHMYVDYSIEHQPFTTI